jgi:alpha-glucosidase (family GH31 glycosyl hydrolase)
VNSNPLGITITRNSDSKNIFNMAPNMLFGFNNQEIGFVNLLGYNMQVLGLGERVTSFVLTPGQYTLFSRDRTSPIDNGQTPDANMYSMHPFYVAIDNNLQAHGGFFLNSNLMTAYVG